MPVFPMKGYTRRRLLASVKLGLAAVPFMVALGLVHGFEMVPGWFIGGFGAGFMVGVAELFLLKNWLRELPFLAHLAGKSLTLIAVLYLTFAVLNLLRGRLHDLGRSPRSDLRDGPRHPAG